MFVRNILSFLSNVISISYKGEIIVNLPKERNENIVITEEFINIKKQILNLM